MKPNDFAEAMQGISQAEAAISRMWAAADGPGRARLLEANGHLDQARASLHLFASPPDTKEPAKP